jgi:hypothetical protein
VYLLVILGIGLFISNYTDTQQQAMFIAWFYSDFYSNEWIVPPSNMAGSTLTIVKSASGNLLENTFQDHFIIAFYAFL